jgi:HEPN domain-containing protein
LKFVRSSLLAHTRTSNPKPHSIHELARVLTIPKFVLSVLRGMTNFAIGTRASGKGQERYPLRHSKASPRDMAIFFA